MTMAAMKQPFQQPAPAGVPAPKFVQKQNEEDDVDDAVVAADDAGTDAGDDDDDAACPLAPS